MWNSSASSLRCSQKTSHLLDYTDVIRTWLRGASFFCIKQATGQKQMHKPSINYSVRVSPRGRNVRLRVTVRHGLEVVIPQGYDRDKVPSIIESKKHWIRSALE